MKWISISTSTTTTITWNWLGDGVFDWLPAADLVWNDTLAGLFEFCCRCNAVADGDVDWAVIAVDDDWWPPPNIVRVEIAIDVVDVDDVAAVVVVVGVVDTESTLLVNCPVNDDDDDEFVDWLLFEWNDGINGDWNKANQVEIESNCFKLLHICKKLTWISSPFM